MKRSPRWSGGCLAVVLLAALLLFTLPISHAEWREVLGVGGSVALGAWSPTASSTPTATEVVPPSATPVTPAPPEASPTPTEASAGQAGTSLEAALTAAGFIENDQSGVSGVTCVTNVGDASTVGLLLTNRVQVKTGPGPFEDVAGAAAVVAPIEPLLPGQSTCYDYRLAFDLLSPAQYRAVALVTILNHSGWLPGGPHCAGPEPCPFGPEPKTEFELPAPPEPGRTATEQPSDDPVDLLPTATETAPPLTATLTVTASFGS